MKLLIIPALICGFAIPAVAQESKQIETGKKVVVTKEQCDKLGNFEIQDLVKCKKAEFKKDPVCTKLGNFEIQQFKACGLADKTKKPEADSLGNFEIQD